MEILKTDSVDTAVTTLFGDGLRITGRRPVYGGDINQSYRLSLSDGSALFMKCNSIRNLPFFTAEAQGLAALHGTGAIGVSKPVSVFVDTFGTGKLGDDVIADIVKKEFDLRPAAIIKTLGLREPIFSQTAAYGHFGKPNTPWERVNRVESLKKYL